MFSYESVQSGTWYSQFNLKKLFWNSLTYQLTEFISGLRLEVYYWFLDQAFCFNVLGYINPVTFTVKSSTKLEQCTKTVVNCLDNWSQWTSPDELLIGTCTLSSAEEVKAWEWKPVETLYERYFFGTNQYIGNFCWPGPSPLYSKFDEFPDNPVWALIQMVSSLQNNFKVARAGLEYNAKAFEGPIVRNSWDTIKKNTLEAISRDLLFEWFK